MAKAAFFDRDGTLIKDVHYLSKLSDVILLPGIINYCLSLQEQGYSLFVVTNQSGIARGFFDKSFVEETHRYLNSLFSRKGVQFKKFYYCPHGPNDGCCCRKPSAGMLKRAAQEFDIDLSSSLMFGDKESDLLAGENAGCKSFYIQKIFGDFS